MIYTDNTNRVNWLKWNPLEIFRQSYLGEFAADFSHVTYTIHIQSSLNYRLLPAVNIFCFNIEAIDNISRIRFRNHKITCTVVKQRKFESNQFDNLSPPCIMYFSYAIWCH